MKRDTSKEVSSCKIHFKLNEEGANEVTFADDVVLLIK